VAKRIDAGDNRLTAVEWKSGSNMRIIEFVVPLRGQVTMRDKFKFESLQ
jgi:cytolysin-activating lysine-acyltransferase